MKNIKEILSIIIILTIISFNGYSQSIEDTLSEINNSFTINKKEIPPNIFESMMPWISDEKPSIIEINILEAIGSNQFFYDTSDGIYYTYEWLGRLKNGYHVIKTIETSDGGRGVYESVGVFEFLIKENPYYSSKYIACVLKYDFILGDRSLKKVFIDKNTISIHKENKKVFEKKF